MESVGWFKFLGFVLNDKVTFIVYYIVNNNNLKEVKSRCLSETVKFFISCFTFLSFIPRCLECWRFWGFCFGNDYIWGIFSLLLCLIPGDCSHKCRIFASTARTWSFRAEKASETGNMHFGERTQMQQNVAYVVLPSLLLEWIRMQVSECKAEMSLYTTGGFLFVVWGQLVSSWCRKFQIPPLCLPCGL